MPMKKTIKYIIGITIILICVILIIVFVKQNQSTPLKVTPLKVNEINIEGKVIQLTANKSDYSEYEDIENFSVYDNKYNFEIEIQNPNILTYKDIKVGDSADKLDFCNEIGTIFCYETGIKYKHYYLVIYYGVNPFDDTIISITYNYY